MDKVWASAAEAVADIPDGASLAVGGFGLSGIPDVLIQALHAQGATGLQVVSNNCGVDGRGLGVLLAEGRIARVTGSYVGENREFARQYLSGELEVELVPQGTLAERLRAGGAGIPPSTPPPGWAPRWPVADCPGATPPMARSPWPPRPRRPASSPTAVTSWSAASPPTSPSYGWRGDRHGNLVFRKSSANFNPLAATAGRITVAEVEELVEPGELRPDEVHLPGIFVQRIVELTPAQAADKQIEHLLISASSTRGTVRA
jgi:3-oxoacid CoA-transferase subunit A